ncbi:MAG TPA: PQQ-binding-like beta-propeller repeat protein [Planctomycetota bacterium]|nr:PQQ-binding-like beta-propeller repeat protein [Planctomycetota bacterium]
MTRCYHFSRTRLSDTRLPLPPRAFAAAGLAIALLGLPRWDLRAVDMARIPLQSDGARIREALAHLEARSFREAIEILQGALNDFETVVRVPDDLPSDAKGLHLALASVLSPSGARGPGRPAGPDVHRLEGQEEDEADPGDLERRGPSAGAGISALGRRFLPVALLARAALAALPAEGLAVYGDLFDSLASDLLAAHRESGDREPLLRVAREFFLTRVGDDAAELVGDALFEEGLYGEALGWWRKTLREHPDPKAPARVRRKVLRVLRRFGTEKEYALEREAWLHSRPGESAFLAQIEALPRVAPGDMDPPAAASRWGGEIHAGRHPSLPPGDFQLSWDSWIWSRRGFDTAGGLGDRRLRPSLADRTARHFPILPLIDGDDVYVSGVFSLFRLDGKPGGGSLQAELKKPAVSGLHDYREPPGNGSPLYTATLWKKAGEPLPDLASLPEEVLITHYVSDRVLHKDFMNYDIFVELPTRSLVAFDARSRKELWRTASSKAGPPAAAGVRPGREATEDFEEDEDAWVVEVEDDTDLADDVGRRLEVIRAQRGARRFLLDSQEEVALEKDFSYTSPAIVKRGLVVAGGWVQRGYVHVALRGLDLRSGALVWETPLVGSQLEATMFGEMAREPFAGAIAEENGIVYYATQLGVVAAVKLETGRLEWLTTYDTIEVVPSFSQKADLRDLSWGSNPLLLLGNLLIVAPRDSEQLLALDRGTGPAGRLSGGRLLWWYSLRPRTSAMEIDLRDLLGEHNGLLYFTGSSEVAALDVRSLDAFGRLGEGIRTTLRGVVELTPRKLPPLRARSRIPGPGFLTAAGILYADQDGLRLASLDLRSERALTPAPFRRSGWGSYPGRVQVSGGRIYLTSRQLISAYAAVPEAPRQ